MSSPRALPAAHAAFKERYGPFALVAGASAGLGAEFATQLAARGLSLLLVARRAEALAELAEKLAAEHGVEVRTAAMDLAAPDLLARLRVAGAGIEVGLLVYNAAYAPIGRFLDQSTEEKLRTIDVNCRGPVLLGDEYGRPMAARRRGGMIFMSSLAASQGSALVATYAATKAFNLVLAEGLWDELAEQGVDVLACRAGATRTPAYERSQPRGDVPVLMDPAPVVAEALAALGRAPSVVPGRLNRLSAFFLNRLLSRRAAVRLIGRTTRRLYG